MGGLSWLSWLMASALAGAFVVWVYRRRETPVRGRGVLAALRAMTITVLLLLVFDPELPGPPLRGGSHAVIVDASLSMRMAGDGATRWERAISLARSAGATEVIVFGDAAHTMNVDSLAASLPSAAHSRLLPALQAVAEAGRPGVTVLTDGAIEDADEVARWLPRLGIDVILEVVPGQPPNRALSRVTAPAFAGTGEDVTIQFDIAAGGGATGPVSVVVRESATELGRTVIETPASGRVSTGSVTFRAGDPPPGGYARYDVTIEADDAVADDDTRPVYVNITDEPAGAVLVSFRPDWEPRFLQPVLERSLGVPVRGYLRSGGSWIALGAGAVAGRQAENDEVRRAVARSEMLVLHGFGPASPEWAREAAAAARRLIVLPAGEGDVAGVPVRATPPVAADWYLSAEVPASPVAHLLAGIEVADVPPLRSLRLPGHIEGTWAPVVASRGRRGAPQPIALAGSLNGRRWVLALGDGFWRWAFWSDDARAAYERLWSAVAGWVLGDVLARGPDAVAPARRTIARDAPPAWVAYGLVPDSLRVLLRDMDGETVTDTVVAAAATDTIRTRALPPGTYDYEVSAWSGDEVTRGSGELSVESYSPEFTRPPVERAVIEAAPGALAAAGRERLPLHATVWPYALVILLLSLEWVLRRRWGLR